MKIEIKNIKRADGKGFYDVTFYQDEKGRWIDKDYEKFPDLMHRLESEVIEYVEKHDRKNLHKYFPMAGFHN